MKYEIIASYPGCPWNKGRVLEEIRPGIWDSREAPASPLNVHPSKWPHIFKELKDNEEE